MAPGLTFDGVPDDVSDAEVRARAIYEGDIPDPGNGFNQFLIGAGKWYADRSQGLIANDVAAPDTWQATLGGVAPAVAGAYLGGGSVLAQAGIGAGAEALREGSTGSSIAGQGALSAGATGLTNMASRVVRGGLNAYAARKAMDPLLSKAAGGVDDVMARTARGAGGFDLADQINKTVLGKAFQRALGLPGKADKIDETVFAQGRAGIAQLYANALPTAPVNVTAAETILQQIPKEAGPAINEALAVIKSAGGNLTPLGWQRLHSSLREFRPLLMKSNWATWTTAVDDVLSELDEAAANAGGDKVLLGIANQRFKVLSIGEEMDSLVVTGEIEAGQLFRKLGAKGWHGFGRRAAAEGNTANLLPETAHLLEVSKILAGEGRKLATGSATASRAALFGPGLVAAGGLATGQLDPQEAASMAALGLAPRLMGTALLAKAGTSGVQGAVGQEAGQLLGERMRE